MTLEANKLRELLSDEVEKERRAHRRFTLPIILTALVGLLWLGYSAYNVVRLERKSSTLTTEISDLEKKKIEVQNELADKTQRLEAVKKDLDDVEVRLENIAAGKTNPKAEAQNALIIVRKASRVVNLPKTGTVSEPASPIRTPTSPPTDENPPQTPSVTPTPVSGTCRPGFNKHGKRSVRYGGTRGESIYVEVKYEGIGNPDVIFGLNNRKVAQGTSFRFDLKAGQELLDIIATVGGVDTSGTFNVIITTSSGQTSNFEYRTRGNRFGALFYFCAL